MVGEVEWSGVGRELDGPCGLVRSITVLDYPVDFGGEFERILFELVHQVLPHLECLFVERREAMAFGETAAPG